MKALILDGKVVDLSETEFEVHSSFTWVDATSDAEVGGSYSNGVFGPEDTRTDAHKLSDRWAYIRSERNKKLKVTDYLALSDQTLSSDMATYRQALRDITTQSDPFNITWPTEPS